MLTKLLLCVSVHTQWTVQNYDTNYTLTDLNFLDENTGLACGEKYYPATNSGKGVIYRTTNSGDNWNIVFTDTNFEIRGSYFYNSNTIIAFGGYLLSQSKIVKTTNSGVSWFYIPSGEINGHIRTIESFGTVFYATTASGIFKSTNNGENWLRVLPQFGEFGSSYFLNEFTGYAAYDLGYLYKTSNGGINWVQTILPGFEYAHKIFFTDVNNGFVILDTTSFISKILRTTNGGINWFEINPGLQNHFWSMFFVNQNTGYISGTGGSVIKTTDSGISWAISWTGGWDVTIRDLYFFDPYKGVACGGNSLILKTTNGGFIGIEPISILIPDNFSLSQNYPNPFNPNTKIKFAIPKLANVRLAVYDLLGREVESLVNQQLTPGTYEVNWNALKFSSGIYLYKLTSNDFLLVKKMSLVK
ncbi:MAG: T9SS type A sorting domain-containing protein [Ignavibacteria bacterium]|nr:T9SS type A sorting domain-containing protein [Ignavibacteria bacterium]